MKRWLLILAAVCLFLVCTQHYYRTTIASRVPGLTSAPCDFLPYYQAAQHIVHRESPFLADGYIYPPLLAFLLTPLTPLDYVTARRVWFAISQLLLIASAILLWRAHGRDWASACWIAFVWAFGGAAAEALTVGQVGPVLMFLIVLALTCRHWRRGSAVALGFALKLFPGLLGVAVFLRGERRAIRAMIWGAIAGVLLPWVAVATLLRGPSGFGRSSAWMGTPATLSWSLPSLAVRIVDPARRSFLEPRNWMLGTNLQHFRLPFGLAAAGLAVAVLTLAAGLFALLRTAGLRLREEQMPWAIAALVSLALLAAPVSWTHYQVLEYPGVALLLIHAWRKRAWTQLIAALSLAALTYPLPIYFLNTLWHRWTPHSFNTVYLWTTAPPLASIGLFAMLVTRAARSMRLHEQPRRLPDPPDYIRLRAATRRVRLHVVPLSPSRGASGR